MLALSLKRVCWAQIAYAINADFFSNGKHCIERLQDTISWHAKLYEVMGAKTQKEKVMFYF